VPISRSNISTAGVGELGLHLDGEGGEDREPPSGLEAGEVLGAHRPCRAGDKRVAGLVDTPGVRGIDRSTAFRRGCPHAETPRLAAYWQRRRENHYEPNEKDD
jgi:hypothetical protein